MGGDSRDQDLALGLGGLLPTIKCSTCHVDINISDMGDHVCSPNPNTNFAVTPPPESSPHNHPDMFGYSPPSIPHSPNNDHNNKPTRLGPPPPIDPSAANRPFLHPNPLTPADSDGIRSAHSAPSPGPKSPLRQLHRSQTSPMPAQTSPKLSNFDCAFPPFPPRSNTIADSGMRSRRGEPDVQKPLLKPLPPNPDELAKQQIESDWDIERPISPVLPPTIELSSPRPVDNTERRKSNRHRREVSIDSKMMQRLSMASSKFGSSVGSPGSGISISPGTMARNGRNVMEEIPPLPTGPIQSFTPSASGFVPEPYRFESKEEFEQDRAVPATAPTPAPLDAPADVGAPISPVSPVSPVSPKPRTRNRDGRRTAIYGSFDFHIPDMPPDLPRDADGNVSFANLGQHFDNTPKATLTDSLKEEHAAQESQDSPGPSYRLDEDFSISNFVRGLGISDPYHSANVSTSSSASGPSEAASGSSFSSHPSERRNPSGEENSHSKAAAPDPSSQLEQPLRPVNLHLQNLDSPTDPAFQNGGFSTPQPSEISLPPLPTSSISTPSDEIPPPSITPPPRPSTASSKGRCRGCNNQITGKSVSSKDGRLTGRYHKACFVCRTCREPFETADFYVLDNQPYCAHHYHSLNGTLCFACKKGIEGEYLETDEPSPDRRGGCQKFHPDCFKCFTCKVVLRGDYLEFEGRVYCERDGRRAAQALMMPPPPPSPRMMMPPPPPMSPGPGGRRPMPPPPGYGPPPPGLPMGPRFPSGNPNRGPRLGVPGGPPPPGMGMRRFPERRTTRLMMA